MLSEHVKFVPMIIKSALFFLRIVDFVWDGYDLIAGFGKKIGMKKEQNSTAINIAKPSYSVVRK